MAHLNLEVFRAVNGLPDALSPFLVFFSVAMNQLWVKIALGLLVVGMVWRPGRARQAAVRALIAVAIANGVTDLFKHLDGMPRPCGELVGVALHGVGCGPSMGTASAHSANMAAVATVFVLVLGWWGSPWVIVALLTGISRMYVGAHYPYQVLLGWVCGIVVAAPTALAFLPPRRTRDATDPPGERDTPDGDAD